MALMTESVDPGVEELCDSTLRMDIESADLSTSQHITDSEFNYRTIESLGNRVRLSDSNDKGLELYCYVHCNSNDNTVIQNCRGVVFHEKKLVMKAFPYTIEYSDEDVDEIDTQIGSIFEKCEFYDSHEGALIRMFHFDGQWYVCTHRKLNAFRSKWASNESFGTSFKRALEEELQYNEDFNDACYSESNDDNILDRFQATLDTHKQYMFLLCHTKDNRIVCHPPEGKSKVYHVGTFIDGVLSMKDRCLLNYPTKRSFQSVHDLVEYVKQTDIKFLQGIIVFAPDNRQFKINNRTYMEFFKVRGNEPSIKFRYLQVRMNRRMVDTLYFLYPEMQSVFDNIENILYEIARTIYTAYIQRFIKKRFVTVPVEDFAVIKECHKWHEEDRANNRIHLEKVVTVLNRQQPTNLNHMIRRYKLDKEQSSSDKKAIHQRNRSNTVGSATMDTKN